MAVVEHTHTNIIQGGVLVQPALESTEVTSISGTLAKAVIIPGPAIVFTLVDVVLTAWAFFPMIYTASNLGFITGHTTDGADPDAPRFMMFVESTASDAAYVVDYRHLTA